MARRAVVAGVLTLAAVLAGCRGGDPGSADPSGPEASETAPGGSTTPWSPGATRSAEPPGSHVVDPPGPLDRRLLPADLLVHARRSLTADEVRAVRRVAGVDHAEPLSLAQVGVQDRVLSVAAVDPASYRRFTQRQQAQHQEVWDRVAGGELAVDPRVGRRLQDDDGALKLGNDQDAPRVHIGALSTQVPQVDAVLNTAWGEELGMPADNALLVSTGLAAPQVVRPRIERLLADLLGVEVSVQVLGPDLDVTAVQTAYLTGGSVADAVGSFSYRVLGGGRIAPQESWVAEHIRTEQVPILGKVTCHRVMLPQLRAALAEIQSSGLAAEIHPDEYAGCYYPRFIAGSTALSLHSFGIALDLNVPGNQRGTRGEMHPQVVSIFDRWGFAWGGLWSWTDPMHFEMDRLVEVR